MRRTPKHYDIEFKQRAAQMVLDGRGPTEVARDLDIPLSCLRRWKKDLLEKMDQGGAPGERSASDMAAEMDKPRRELADVTVQRDILKKTIRIFDEMDGAGRRRSTC